MSHLQGRTSISIHYSTGQLKVKRYNVHACTCTHVLYTANRLRSLHPLPTDHTPYLCCHDIDLLVLLLETELERLLHVGLGSLVQRLDLSHLLQFTLCLLLRICRRRLERLMLFLETAKHFQQLCVRRGGGACEGGGCVCE